MQKIKCPDCDTLFYPTFVTEEGQPIVCGDNVFATHVCPECGCEIELKYDLVLASVKSKINCDLP